LLVDMKNRGVTTTLYNAQSDFGGAHQKLAGITVLIIRKEAFQAEIIGITDRMQLRQIQFK
jgi:hypothetical protein